MHSRKHGKSGSKKPTKRIKSEQLIYDRGEVEKIVMKMAKEGMPSTKIGVALRDQYGIPDVRAFKTRIMEIVEKEMKKEVPEDLYNLLKKAVNLRRHLHGSKKDAAAVHGVELIESKIRRLGKYYARTGKLPKDWKYTLEAAKLLVR